MKRWLVLLVLAGCGVARPGDKIGTVYIGRCQVIIEDSLGELPPSHGGPYSLSMSGTGLMCTVFKFD